MLIYEFVQSKHPKKEGAHLVIQVVISNSLSYNPGVTLPPLQEHNVLVMSRKWTYLQVPLVGGLISNLRLTWSLCRVLDKCHICMD